jgi:hypothetical protein
MAASIFQLLSVHVRSFGGQGGLRLPFWNAPEPWLQLLVNDKSLLDKKSLQCLMSTSWSVCKAVLRCMQRWRLRVLVRSQLHAWKWPLVGVQRQCCGACSSGG